MLFGYPNFLFFFLQKKFQQEKLEERVQLNGLNQKYLDKHIHFLMKV